MGSHPASGGYKYRGLVLRDGVGRGAKSSKKFSRILWRRPRPKLGCGAKERKKKEEEESSIKLSQLKRP